MFIDVHCHLDLLSKEEDLNFVIDNAKKNNVFIVSDGVNIESNREMLEYNFDNVSICLGLYPIDIESMAPKDIEEEIEFIRKNKDKIIGIGEVGMDFVKGESEKQKKYFKDLIKLGIEIDKPLIVHSRKAEKECIKILEELKAKRVIMHYFSGNLNLAKRVIENKWLLSIPTAVKNSEHFQKIVEITPLNQLLCETDSPYSHPDKKFPNEPANVLESYKMISKIKGLGIKEVEEQIENNFNRIFK